MKKLLLILLAAAVSSVGSQAAKPVKLIVETASEQLLPGDKIKVNGKETDLAFNKKGVCYVEVEASADGRYSAAYPADCAFIDNPTDSHMRLVPMQVYKAGAAAREYMPMYAAEAADGKLSMKNLCGVLKITLKGDACINCIKVEDNSGAYLSGYFNYDAAAGKLVCRPKTAAGVGFAVLDCSNGGKGVELDGRGTDFYIVMPARNYPDGLTVSVTDRAHRMSVYDLKHPLEITRDAVAALPALEYKPADDLVFAEHFDNFVYGGNRVGGKHCKGFGPVKTNGAVNYLYDGTERAVYLSEFGSAGSTYIQDDYTVSLREAPVMSRKYLNNRNIADWNMMFRAQEYQGFIGVGVKDNTRGIVATPALSGLDGLCDIEVTFKVSLQAKATSCVLCEVMNAGIVKEYYIDGIRRSFSNINYPFVASNRERIRIKNGAIPVPKTEEESKPWHTVRLVIGGATSDTRLQWLSEQSSGNYVNGFFLDDIEVRLLRSVPRSKILRVMDYNIQNGMWADQQNNYDNFVEYMKSADPDIAIFCEAQTIYYNGTNKHMKRAEQYLPYKYKDYQRGVDPNMEPEGWIELAARWGHTFVKVGAHQDNYPVVITSKYPITFTQKLGGPEVSHGGLHAQVSVDGETVNLVGFHTWPQAWRKSAKTPAEREQSKLEHGGDKTREDEFRIFMERTILNPEYAGEKNWLIMGDMNCATPLDDGFHDLGVDNPRYLGQKYMLENVPAFDLVKVYNTFDRRDVIIPSTQGWGRIDLMYGSEPMMKRMIKAKSPKEGFTLGKWNKDTRFFDKSSDHLPVIVDFEWRK
ncbi:MAG: hypothetical protein J6K28_01725 [Alistipes sp.]|nr:hypothetical protein [Alistipes sp.]